MPLPRPQARQVGENSPGGGGSRVSACACLSRTRFLHLLINPALRLLCSCGHASLCLLDHSWAQGSLVARDGDSKVPSLATRVSTVCQEQQHQALSPSSSHQIFAATLAGYVMAASTPFYRREIEAGQVPYSGHIAGNSSQDSSQPHQTPSPVLFLHHQVASQGATNSRTHSLHPNSFW